ncbi:MAG: bifunctional diaminohydroxyphosphoribosylaminopyrimidine deaminase/5-amino-6-(5-phosphoribosylamino)uracil reductase RibD [Planctomycetaceae bacterium]|nr:bifunctional diaminohydroxyphosphoribosylaminopyrimidine deaminase/5-amino-6-(5-phosphoribosylamino)uracil reductase RibD [Planctomycetaceae bacterium]
MPDFSTDDKHWMARAMELAKRGEGFVEPNPMVGCVLTSTHHLDACHPGANSSGSAEVFGAEVIGEGWHKVFGGAHAEIEAIRAASLAEKSTKNATAYVTLEPCCHHGKTPPCVEALIKAEVRRVVIAMRDPFTQVNGGGIDRLREAGIDVSVGCLESNARELNAPYLMRLERHRPWVIAKWAMTLDGKMATHTGSSRWVTSEASRNVVHQLRARMDAVMVGSRTAGLDDPLLTVRRETVYPETVPNRTPLRIVFDSHGTLSPKSRLARTAHESLVIVAASEQVLQTDQTAKKNAILLADSGCEVIPLKGETHHERLLELFADLAKRGATNLLVEGGGTLLGHLFDHQLIDETHVFIAPKLIGGKDATFPIAGLGITEMSDACELIDPVTEPLGHDIYCHGRLRKP